MKNKRNAKPQVVSIFSGCGGFDLGFKQAGFEIVFANDNNESACMTHKRNFNSYLDPRSIEKINPYNGNQVPDCDLILGGFPCQDFSAIWKQPGIHGDRGKLYRNFVKFVAAKKPKAFVAENVKGLLSANNGAAIRQILQDFKQVDPGYNLSCKVYNFADYGVPQIRERAIIVGIRSDLNFEFLPPHPTHNPSSYVSAAEALHGVEKVTHNAEPHKITKSTKDRINMIPPGGNFSSIPKDHPLFVKGMISHVYRRLHPDKPSTTIIAAGGGGTLGYHHSEPRPLTNRERARLQTFPDDFVFEGSISQVRKQIGNAVPPRGAKALATALLSLFDET